VEEFGLLVIGGAFIRLLIYAEDVMKLSSVAIIPIMVSKTPDWVISPWTRASHFLCWKESEFWLGERRILAGRLEDSYLIEMVI